MANNPNSDNKFPWLDMSFQMVLDVAKIVIPPASLAFSMLYGWNYVAVKALPTVAVPLDLTWDTFGQLWTFCYFWLLLPNYNRKD